ncbi:MAG: C_GCAxxG_C_C family protein [Lachnospiraceae bacterium]|nr:C_GCAxxG_C_C family protein [Lachnospiraceae bacterium]
MQVGHGEKAKQLFMEGYNCSQAVLGAFCEECGLDFDTAMKMSSSFGGGMGRLREVCGAVSGMFMVAGLIYGYDDPTAQEEKAKHYERIQKLAEKFRKENGSIVCRELLGLAEKKSEPKPEQRSAEYYKKRPCPEMVKMEAEIMEQDINQNLR